MIIGYIRVSKEEQNENLQIDALKKYGCEKLYIEKISGVISDDGIAKKK
jgi:DNA invertase Pin-like site-specific DNA recombinase